MTTTMLKSAVRGQGRASEPRAASPVLAPGGEFSVGVEEELFLLDALDHLDPDACGRLLLEVGTAARLPGAVSAELFAAEIEYSTSVCTEAGQIVPQLRAFRRALAAAGGRTMAAGLHPDAPFGDPALTSDTRYAMIGDSLAGLLRTATAAFQVHVGLPDETTAIQAYRGMRHRLAVLQALASNSPYWHGRDSGLASARWAVIASYPRGGVPPVVQSWDEYAALVTSVRVAAEAPDDSHVWFDARLQPRLGTLEIRVMDAQPSVEAGAGLAALAQGLVRYSVDRPIADDVPSAVLAENSFRVARHGLETTIADLDGSMRSVRELAATMLEEARTVLRADGLEAPLAGVEKLLCDETDYARQRRLHAEDGIAAVVEDLADRTARG